MLFRCKMLKLHLGISLCVFTLPCLVTADDQDGPAFLLYCAAEIHNFSLASGTDSLLMSGIERPWVVDYHMKSKVFFWTDENSAIYKAPLWQEGARPTVLRSGVHSYGLAVDWIHNLIFWTEYYNGAIGVSRLDGSMVRTVLKEKGIKPNAIVLNPVEGFMFWSDNGVTRKIERCNMDGTNRMVIVKKDISWVNDLAIDLDSQMVFWVDIGKDYLSSAKFDGSHRRNLITQLLGPTSIDIYGQLVYFVTFRDQTVYKASKVDGSGLTKVFGWKARLWSLKVFHPSKQLEGSIMTTSTTSTTSVPSTKLPSSYLPFTVPQTNFTSTFGSIMTTPRSTASEPSTKLPSSYLPFTAPQTNFTSTTGSIMTTPILTTSEPSTKLLSTNLPFTVPQTNFTSTTEENKNGVATVGPSGTHLILAVVIASVAFIAMVGMLIYIRHLLTRTVVNAVKPYPVQGGNYDKYMYMEGPL